MTGARTPVGVEYFAGAWDDVAIDRGRARQLLQCDEEGLERRIADGLPRRVDDSEEAFGYCDVMNAGLYSGSGRSVAEIAERYLVRFGEQPPERWTEAQPWVLTLTGSCTEACVSARAPSRPQERAGVAVTRDWRRETVGGVRRWLLEVTVAGTESRVASPPVRALYERTLEELRSGVVRYQYLPRRLRLDPAAARELGVADCMTTALTLQRACEELEVPSRVRLGYLLGMVSIEHAWLEVLDDGVYKPLDPVLAALVSRSPRCDRAPIADFCLGSLPNGVLPWPPGAASPLHGTECEHSAVAPSVSARPCAAPA